MLSNVSQVTDIRDEPENDSGLVEKVQTISSASEEHFLRAEIPRLCDIEHLTEELVLRNEAEIVYLQQLLEEMHVSSSSSYKLHRSSMS
jgi:hypothetical protein